MTTLSRRLAAVVVVLACAHTAAAQTAEEIIEKSIAAMGGRAAMEKIKTRISTGKVSLATPGGDVTGTVELYDAAPNKQRMVMKVDLTPVGAGEMIIDQRFDGATGYVTDSIQGNRDITGSELDNLQAAGFPHVFLRYQAHGMSAKLSRESVADRVMYLLTFERTGYALKQYVDAGTFLPARVIIRADLSQLGQLEHWIDSSDYRDVDGVKVPFKVTLTNSMMTVTTTFTTIENNVSIDPKMFVKAQ